MLYLAETAGNIYYFTFNSCKGDIMSDSHHEHHAEDHSVNVKVAIFFVAVLTVLTIIGLMQ